MPDPPYAVGSAAWIDSMLKGLLGSGATTGELGFEGRFLRIEGARLPLGSLRLEVDRAEVELGAGLPLGELPLSARLVSLRAVLHAAAPRGPVALSIELTAGNPKAPSWLSGTVRARGAFDLTATLDVTPVGWALREVRVTVGASTAELAASGSVVPPSLETLTIARAPASVLRSLVAALVPLPPVAAAVDDSALTGALRRAAGTLTGDLVVAGPRTRVTLALALDASGCADGSRLTGRLALADALALGLPSADLAPGPETTLELDLLTAHGSLSEPALRGRVFSAAVLLGRRSRPGAGPLRLDNVRASIDVDRRRLRYQDLRGDACGARFAGWGRLPLARPSGGAEAVPLVALAVEGAGIALMRTLAALAGAAVRIPSDLAVSGEIMVEPSLAASGAFAVETPRTQLLLQLAVAPGGSLVGSRLRGRLAAADAITLGIFGSPVRPRPPAVLDIDARLTGTVARPGITGRATCTRLVLDVSADASAPSFAIDDASVLLDVDAERIAWHRFTGRFYGGTFSSSGDAARSCGLHATLAWGGVRVELLPTHASGESRLASLLHGAASGELRFARHGLGDAPLRARGHIALAEPCYLVTRALAPQLDRYRLPRLRSRGRGPLSARLHLERGVIRVESLAAALDGVEVAGDVHLGLDGRLAGSVVVDLLEAYLAESALLAIPAALAGRVSVPVELGGTVRAPEIRTDARQILEGLLSRNRVGDAVKSVIGGLRGAAPKRR